jgi:hypothetical protein
MPQRLQTDRAACMAHAHRRRARFLDDKCTGALVLANQSGTYGRPDFF